MARDAGSIVTEVARCENWKNRVRTEYEIGRSWHSKWGFMAPESAKSNDSIDSFLTNTAKRSASSYISANLRDTVTRKHNNADAIDSFVETYITAHGGPRLYPKQEFKKPVLVSHDYGWRKNLERFGPLTIHLR